MFALSLTLGAILALGCERAPASHNTDGTDDAKAPAQTTPAPAAPRWSDASLVQAESRHGRFICPMFCENDPSIGPRTHDSKTTCSICKMDLEPVAELKYDLSLAPAKPNASGRAAHDASGVLFAVRVLDPLGEPVKPDSLAPMFTSANVRASDDSWRGDAHAATLAVQDGKLIVKLLVPKAGRYLVSGTLTPPKESGREPSEFLAAVSIE